jgi:uncharacterized protein YcfL
VKNIFFILSFFVLLFLSACTSSNIEKENTNTSVVKDETITNELLTKPSDLSKEDIKKIKYQDLEEDIQGGIVNVKNYSNGR